MTVSTTNGTERSNARVAGGEEATRTGPVFRPSIDIIETGETLVVEAEMPGVRTEDIDIDYDNRVLTVRGRVRPRQAERTTFLAREYGVGDFERTFRVSEDVDANRISAELSGGILTVRLPKAEAAKPRKIQVQARA